MKFKRTVQLISALAITSVVLVTVINASADDSVVFIVPASEKQLEITRSVSNPIDIETVQSVLKSASVIKESSSETPDVQPSSADESQTETDSTAVQSKPKPPQTNDEESMDVSPNADNNTINSPDAETDELTTPQTGVQPAPPPQSTSSNKKTKTEKSSDKKTGKSSGSSTVSPENNSNDPVSLIKSIMNEKESILLEKINTLDSKWTMRAISDIKINPDKGEVIVKASLKYTDDDWTSLRANANIQFEILVGDIDSRLGIRFAKIDKLTVLDPSVDVNASVSSFEEKLNEALKNQYFWINDTAPESFIPFVEKDF